MRSCGKQEFSTHTLSPVNRGPTRVPRNRQQLQTTLPRFFPTLSESLQIDTGGGATLPGQSVRRGIDSAPGILARHN